jgi:hypothetical protein
VIFAFLEGHQQTWPVKLLCEALGVSTSGFSAWLSREPSAAQKRRDALLVEIRAVPAEVKGR